MHNPIEADCLPKTNSLTLNYLQLFLTKIAYSFSLKMNKRIQAKRKEKKLYAHEN